MKNKKVCIIDDDHLIIEMYKVKLELEGFEVVSAQDGEEGYEVIKKEKPDIVLVDLMMPNRDGFYVMKKLKKDGQLCKVPIIVLTNMDVPEMRRKACELGALFFIVKSQCLPKDLTKIVREILSASENHPETLACGQ